MLLGVAGLQVVSSHMWVVVCHQVIVLVMGTLLNIVSYLVVPRHVRVVIGMMLGVVSPLAIPKYVWIVVLLDVVSHQVILRHWVVVIQTLSHHLFSAYQLQTQYLKVHHHLKVTLLKQAVTISSLSPSCSYRIPQIFRVGKISWFSRFTDHPRNFYPRR